MKSRRDITLGEMQDECKRRLRVCAPDVNGDNECKYFETCRQMRLGFFLKECPETWDLTDPPRFNEAQMAFWRSLYDVGVKYVFRAIKWICLSDDENPEYAPVANLGTINISAVHDWLKLGETLDLAELLGKDGDK